MDIWTLLRTAVRRWYVALPILVAALAIGLATALSLQPSYTATSTTVLTGPQVVYEQGESVRVNPFLNLGGSLNNTTQVMRVLMDSETKRLEHAQRGLVEDYEVDRNDAVISFEVTGDDPEAVVFTARELITILDEEIALLQADPPSPPEQRVAAAPITVPSQATPDTGGRLQLLAVAGVVGLLLALAAAALVDGISRSRAEGRARRAEEAAADDGAGGPTAPAAPATSAAPAAPAAPTGPEVPAEPPVAAEAADPVTPDSTPAPVDSTPAALDSAPAPADSTPATADGAPITTPADEEPETQTQSLPDAPPETDAQADPATLDDWLDEEPAVGQPAGSRKRA